MITIGLTGDVGAGKSTLCKTWKEMGAEVIDADTIARDMWKLDSVQKKAEARWGEGFFTGTWKEIYAKIAGKIFTNQDDYDFASELLHKPTQDEIKRRIKESDAAWVIAEVPLLYENGAFEFCDYVVYATASVKKRVERNSTRAWTEQELIRREKKLMPRKEKIGRADFVLRNRGSLERWQKKAAELGEIFIAMSQKNAEPQENNE